MQKTIVPPLPLTGGCQCGLIRYRLRGRPLVFYLCHCSECQRHTSSAFGESLRFRSADLEVEPGLHRISRTSETGKQRQGWFCPQCGVRIWHGTAGSPEINIKAGTLDDTSWLIPAGHIWARSKQPFIQIADDELQYQTQPTDDYAALKQRWLEMTQDMGQTKAEPD
ncbi:GFA family protein [Hoeflea sp. YIM 152468]|uniref:GFA family protein n=1 Tax=Hoeflea sp. YIM 152468 TaxID=3031759 RepID=UPI0023D9D1A9|nr:GFA family protein [Hoeflea sp. YIM 152468]MDF1607940.1 GFA family protein [Hoeflea sp. YIM 152468]